MYTNAIERFVGQQKRFSNIFPIHKLGAKKSQRLKIHDLVLCNRHRDSFTSFYAREENNNTDSSNFMQ